MSAQKPFPMKLEAYPPNTFARTSNSLSPYATNTKGKSPVDDFAILELSIPRSKGLYPVRKRTP